uniref:NADH-ubiquinone oxidoreductase chain 3 n=1 Tax=Ditaxis biseriata TaxID=560959 RepID=C8YXH5_DITBI|nr:NADH dehydrogenase subunit 3 [Ditaxis biseriata]ACO92609.1 NADH dehydrogenase subunit 3 [Ditaxis biseriata]
MILLISMSMIIMIISIITMMMASILSKKSFYDREKNSPFECGFDPKSSARLPFSLHFFLIAIIFLIFDVEIALLMPSILTINSSNMYMWIFIMIFFILILLLGLYHEWNQGALEWSN